MFTREEVAKTPDTPHWHSASHGHLLYGAGFRLLDVRLRVQDPDFAYYQIIVREGKEAQDRVTLLPQSLEQALQRHLVKVRPVGNSAGQVLCFVKLPVSLSPYFMAQ